MGLEKTTIFQNFSTNFAGCGLIWSARMKFSYFREPKSLKANLRFFLNEIFQMPNSNMTNQVIFYEESLTTRVANEPVFHVNKFMFYFDVLL